MLDGLSDWLFGAGGLTPHGFCLAWRPGLIWTYAVSDIGIGLAYFTIPVALAVFARRRRDLVFRPIFFLFAAFILLCGSTHWLDVLTLFVPSYGLEAVVKAATAIVSLITAVGLWWLLPHALALPSTRQMQEANAALTTSEARHRANFEHSPVPLYTLDGAGAITAVSESWLALLGYRAAEVIGRPADVFHAPGCEAFSEAERAALIGGAELRDLPRRLLRADGGIVEAQVFARIDRREETVSVLCVLIDVTARKQAEAALRMSEEVLRQSQKMEAVGQLTGGIAHDFNNMLQGIVGSLDRIDRMLETGRGAEIGAYTAAARASAERAAHLTSRMLAFARRQPLQPRRVALDGLLYGMGELIRRSIGPAVTLQLRHHGGWAALCDANQLESAVLNLALNARDAMPDGGVLTIATADVVLTEADLAGQAEAAPGAYVELTVSDTGSGMEPDLLSRVFEPFFTTKPIGQGTGLGLSQVYGFARQSGGLVRLASAPGEGTTVRLYVPRWTQADPAAEPVEHRAEPRGAAALEADGRSILLVDDEVGLRSLMAEALRDAGCRVLEAGSGPDGLEMIQSRVKIDLLLTDIGLPGLNGRQLADAMQQIRPGIPILLITGYAGTALDEAEIAPGMEVMLKPFGLDVLCRRVGALLSAEAVRADA
jgi:PAS domain S-box-containing protein